jgi:hypothetical protein
MSDRFALLMLGPHQTTVLLTDGSWAPLEVFLTKNDKRRPHYQVRVFQSRRRAQEVRHSWPTWQELGIGIVPL